MEPPTLNGARPPSQSQLAVGTQALPALLTVPAGLEGAVPQQLVPSPQVQLIDVLTDDVVHQHTAHAHLIFSVLGDTREVAVDTGAALGRSGDPRVSLGPTLRNHMLFHLPGHSALEDQIWRLGSSVQGVLGTAD